MTVIEFAEKRLDEESNIYFGNASYWAAYLDGARRQKQEDEELYAKTQKHGEWIYVEPFGGWKCSVCGFTYDTQDVKCEHCGAVMH